MVSVAWQVSRCQGDADLRVPRSLTASLLGLGQSGLPFPLSCRHVTLDCICVRIGSRFGLAQNVSIGGQPTAVSMQILVSFILYVCMYAKVFIQHYYSLAFWRREEFAVGRWILRNGKAERCCTPQTLWRRRRIALIRGYACHIISCTLVNNVQFRIFIWVIMTSQRH
jgi:hypothetical protein